MRKLILLLVFSAALAAQTVQGDVVDAVTGAPVVGARISANPVKGGKTLIVRTDAAGHFQFPASASSITQVVVVRPGYLSGMRPCGVTEALRIELPPASVISGKIVDEDGFPVDRAYVYAIRDQFFYGEHRQQIVVSTMSDDQGSYRLNNLPSGRYWIRLWPIALSEWDRRYLTQYYPGTLKADSDNMVEVKTGEERDGVDIQMKKFEGVTISGRIASPGGDANFNRLGLPILDAGIGLPISGSRQADGSFSFSHVQPGDYALHVETGASPIRPGELYARQKLHVGDADQGGIVLQLQEAQPLDLTGAVVTQNFRNAPPMVVEVQDEKKAMIYGQTNADGSFAIKGLLPGHYEIDAKRAPDAGRGAPADTAYPISAMLGGKETLVDGFDIDGPAPGQMQIVVSSREIEITGKLLDSSGRPAPQSTLAFIPVGALYQGVAATNSDGTFKVTLRQPGEYHVYRMADTAHWDDWAFLNAHANDFPVVKVNEGQNAPVDLTLTAK